MHLFLIFVFIVLLILFYAVKIYNGLIIAKQRVREGWSDIETQLKRRYDLIPNLVATVKGYASHEQETLEKVIKARGEAMKTSFRSVSQKAETEEMLSGALKSLFALSENYPELKSNTNFLALQNELSDTENKIQASRRFYNTVVLALNTKVEMFPGNLIANLFHFQKEPFFELSEEEKDKVQSAPSVQF
jgi:LemA protein